MIVLMSQGFSVHKTARWKRLLDFASTMPPGRELAELVIEGRLVRMHGKGTFVVNPKDAQSLELASYTGGTRQHGLHSQTKILDVGYVTADEEVANLLDDLRPGGGSSQPSVPTVRRWFRGARLVWQRRERLPRGVRCLWTDARLGCDRRLGETQRGA